jgi:hypothetical protein
VDTLFCVRNTCECVCADGGIGSGGQESRKYRRRIYGEVKGEIIPGSIVSQVDIGEIAHGKNDKTLTRTFI